MKKLVAILLVVELLIAYFVLGSGCILRQDQVRAFGAWHNNPTPETKAELDRQKRITELINVEFSAVAFAVMGGATLFAARIWRQQGWLWKSLVATGVFFALGVSAVVYSVDRYHRRGPPAQDRHACEIAIRPLVQSHARREQVVQALGFDFVDYSVGSTNRQWLERALYDESARQRAERYPGVLFHATALTMIFLFFDADGRLQDYYLCEQ